ncbi:FkbM family methyltransferase [Mesorhizobium sp. B1-1-7]|uniref:FkbM family methyltransferase n=1 Tax=Mesorhizobium sp. B1-1-7 TaxID=2589977 RepID=UPI00112A1FC5|nr:FkbM family methyltransferase [Mesorhizobium sp. B1-1-7]TPN51555.1 FkbM family methyltransferase [Mesorhizobium sp. B1-1-7]
MTDDNWKRSKPTVEDVRLAYLMLLGREPEDETALRNGIEFYGTLNTLRNSMATSDEGKRALLALLSPSFSDSRVKFHSGRGFDIWLELQDNGVSAPIFLKGRFEPYIEHFIEDRFDTNTTFVDVGANVGWFTMIAAALIANSQGVGQVISFEANPQTAELLQATVQSSSFADFIEVHALAVSNEVASVWIENPDDGNIAGASLSFGGMRRTSRHPASAVLSAPLDQILADHPQRISLIKIDVEGAEPRVIEGARAIIDRHRPALLMEFNAEALAMVSDSTPTKLAKQVERLGYALIDFRGDGVRCPVDRVETLVRENGGYYDLLAMIEGKS